MAYGIWAVFYLYGLGMMIKMYFQKKEFRHKPDLYESLCFFALLEGAVMALLVVPPSSGLLGGIAIGSWFVVKMRSLIACKRGEVLSYKRVGLNVLVSVSLFALISAVYFMEVFK